MCVGYNCRYCRFDNYMCVGYNNTVGLIIICVLDITILLVVYDN